MRRLSADTVYDLSERDILVLNQEVDQRKKRVGTTWLLWAFLGPIGAHYLYLGHWMTGFIRLFVLPIALVVAISTGSFASGFGTSGTSGATSGAALGLVIFWGIFTLWHIWWLVDIFLISGMLRDNEKQVQEEILQELRAMKGRAQPAYSQPMQGQMPYTQPVQGQPPYSQPPPGAYYSPPMQGMGTMPPQLHRCPNCGNSIAYGTNPCPYCRVLNRW